VLIRAAGARDLQAITRLYQAIEDTTWEYTEQRHTLEDRSEWSAEKTAEGWPILVADENGAVLGVATYGDFRDSTRWPGYRFTVEHTIHVDRSRHGEGIGRALMNELMLRAEKGRNPCDGCRHRLDQHRLNYLSRTTWIS
jgi:L-amino acid N-acyltransferase YncA